MSTTQQSSPSPVWYTVILSLAGAVVAVADQVVSPLLPWWGWPLVAVIGAAVTFVITSAQANTRPDGYAIARVFAYREGVWVSLGVITTWVDVIGWNLTLALCWVGGTLALGAIGTVCPTPPELPRDHTQTGTAAIDRRPGYAQKWEGYIRAVTGWKATRVVRWERWEQPEEGFRLWVALPADTGETEGDLSPYCTNLAAAARLKAGCHVQVLPSDVQGVAILDVMEVDNLGKSDHLVHVEPTTPASINDDFTVMVSPRGEPMDICLRIETATIGGATGSGKTTLMNRIIMFLARCTDALIWVADYNGGGLANGWIEPWARGKCERPVVDWVALNENEFALMSAVAREISTARKHNPEARRRIRAARSGGVLPVAPDLPAIIVLADEGGSIQQKLTALGAIAAEGLTQLAQLGRAMGVRSMVSVLRGTSDLMDKGFRTQSSIRLCLRMNEWGEYVHVLDVSPPKTALKHKGSGYLRTMDLDQPVYGRTVNVDEDAIEQHAIACSSLRPSLDPHAQEVAARVQPADVTGGNKEYPGWVGSIQYLHAREGKAYSGRWDRAVHLLAELRDEEYVETVITPTAESLPTTSTPALDSWAAGLTAPTPAPPPVVDQGGGNARQRIVNMIADAGPTGIRFTDVVDAAGVSRQRASDVLRELQDSGAVGKGADGRYVLQQYAASAA